MLQPVSVEHSWPMKALPLRDLPALPAKGLVGTKLAMLELVSKQSPCYLTSRVILAPWDSSI